MKPSNYPQYIFNNHWLKNIVLIFFSVTMSGLLIYRFASVLPQRSIIELEKKEKNRCKRRIQISKRISKDLKEIQELGGFSTECSNLTNHEHADPHIDEIVTTFINKAVPTTKDERQSSLKQSYDHPMAHKEDRPLSQPISQCAKTNCNPNIHISPDNFSIVEQRDMYIDRRRTLDDRNDMANIIQSRRHTHDEVTQLNSPATSNVFPLISPKYSKIRSPNTLQICPSPVPIRSHRNSIQFNVGDAISEQPRSSELLTKVYQDKLTPSDINNPIRGSRLSYYVNPKSDVSLYTRKSIQVEPAFTNITNAHLQLIPQHKTPIVLQNPQVTTYKDQKPMSIPLTHNKILNDTTTSNKPTTPNNTNAPVDALKSQNTPIEKVILNTKQIDSNNKVPNQTNPSFPANDNDTVKSNIMTK